MTFPRTDGNVHDLASVQRVALLAGVFALAAGCSRTPPPPSLPERATAIVLVDPAQISLRAGAAAQLAVQANDASGQPIGGARFRFMAADPKVLQVSDRGLVTALGPAIAQTQVVVASGRAEQRVSVAVLPGPPQRIEKLDGDVQTLHAGETPRPLSARILDGWGNPIDGVPISIEPAATIFPPRDQLSGADGSVHVDLPALTRAGAAVVAMHPKGSATPVESFRLQVAPASPARLSLVAAPAGSGSPKGSAEGVRLLVSDPYGNPVPDVTVRARMSKSDKNPASARSDNDGVATIPVPRSSQASRTKLDFDLVDFPGVRASFTVSIPSR